MNKKTTQSDRSKKGQSLVEFSLMVMLLMLIVAGIVDLGRMFVLYINLRDSVEEGVVFGSISPTDCDGIESRVLENVNNYPAVTVAIEVSGVECEVAAAAPNTYAVLGKEIRVTVTYADFPIVTPFIGAILGSQTIDLSSTITGTILRPLEVTP